MILKLKNDTIEVVSKNITEPRDRVRIKYKYETGADHLSPELNINGVTYRGDNIFIDLSELQGGNVELIVNLLNNTVLVKTYKATLYYHNYIVFGNQDVYTDLNTKLLSLEDQVEELLEKGELI